MGCQLESVKFSDWGVCPKWYHLEESGEIDLRKNRTMTAFNDYRDELERSEQMYGLERGRLAVTLDRITNAMVLVGQHGVYCTSQRNPTVPAMDVRMITLELANAKELLQSVMEELRRTREASLPGKNNP